MGLLQKLGNSDFVKKAVRNNTYIKNVDCNCEKQDPVGENIFFGKNCFCKLDYDLFGQSKIISTHITQPTFTLKVEVDPVNFAKYADTTPLK